MTVTYFLKGPRTFSRAEVTPLSGLPHGTLFKIKLSTEVNAERQIIFPSLLNCVMHHIYDVCQFKR